MQTEFFLNVYKDKETFHREAALYPVAQIRSNILERYLSLKTQHSCNFFSFINS